MSAPSVPWSLAGFLVSIGLSVSLLFRLRSVSDQLAAIRSDLERLTLSHSQPVRCSTVISSPALVASPPAFSLSSSVRQLSGSVSVSGSGSVSRAVIVIDPISTGANIAYEFSRRGIPVVRVLSGYLSPAVLALVDQSIRTEFLASVTHDPADPVRTLQQLIALPVHYIACVSGSELGVELCDFLSDQLALPGNGMELTNARRDKFQMGEAIRRSGVRAVRQARVQSWPELELFLNDLKPTPFRCVLKPIRSAGSDSVFLCSSLAEVRTRFDSILGHQNQLGFVNDCVVVQEYLEGPEYVVDTVSANGVHKVVAIWKYDKGQVNGANFVYFGMGSVDGDSKTAQQLAQYVLQVLDALNIRNSAGHAEVILTADGPCLVEIGSRPHGGEGTFMPLADAVWGYNQVKAIVDSIIDQDAFRSLPNVCNREKKFGYKIDFVSRVSGRLIQLRHQEQIKALKSFVRFDLMPKPGEFIPITLDCFTAVGSVTLAHSDREQVEADVKTIRTLEQTMFDVESAGQEKEAQNRTGTARPGP